MFRTALIAFSCCFVALAAACSDDAGTPAATPTPVLPTPDPAILSAFALAPEDAAPLPGISAAYAPAANGAVSFYTNYGDNTFRVQSTVGAFGDIATREIFITDFRRALVTAIGNERNLDIEGAERAFVYRFAEEGSPSSAALVVKGQYYVLVQMISPDGSGEASVFDDALLQRYVQTSLGRIDQYNEDPTSVEPPDWAPAYAAAAPPVETPAATPMATP